MSYAGHAGRTRGLKIPAGFNLGGEIAEADGLLSEAFYESSFYKTLRSKDDRRCFVIGRTGSGKSASLQRLKEEFEEHIIEINPIDLSLPYITNMDVMQYLTSIDVHMDSLFNALWKHVFLIEVIKHRYKINSLDAKQRFLDYIVGRIRRDNKKKAALAYLEEFEDKFWCETDQRVRDITDRIQSEFKAGASAKLGTGGVAIDFSSGDQVARSTEERVELVGRFQRIVNETQLPRLNTMMSVLNDEILDRPQHFTYLIIDDLDKNWVDDKLKNDLIRNLFQVVFDLLRVRNLKVIVALRSNIFSSLDFGKSGGQDEKFRFQTSYLRWPSGDLEGLLNERVRVAAGREKIYHLNEVSDLLPEEPNENGETAIDYILSRTLMRPRDAIAYINICLFEASGKDRVSWQIIKDVEATYSTGRLTALQDEWSPTYPGIGRVLRIFRECPVIMGREEVSVRLDECLNLLADGSFEGSRWMDSLVTSYLDASSSDWAAMYHAVLKLLYEMGFIGICLGRSGRVAYSYSDPTQCDKVSKLREVNEFAVHPAFRLALDIE